MAEEKQAAGTLYLCGTPIGNLEDMTYRAVRLLGEADIIAAEDTRHTRPLLTHFDIHTKCVSYHEHNKLEVGPQLVQRLLAGENVVCVSDAGLPGIADPGSHLAGLAIEAGICVTPLPGANAALSALICSGLDTTRFTFVGFLPKTAKKRAEVLAEVRSHRETLIFYEAPHRLKASLGEIASALGSERRAAACRELTKKFEEFRRGSLQELIEHYEVSEPRGEFVLIVEGAGEAEEAPGEAPKPREMCEALLEQGLPKKEAMRETARRLGISRRDVYQAMLEENKE